MGVFYWAAEPGDVLVLALRPGLSLYQGPTRRLGRGSGSVVEGMGGSVTVTGI